MYTNIVHGFCICKWYPLIYVHYQKLLCMPCSFEFFVLFTITPQYNRREGDAKIHYEMIVMFLFLFCKETMELRIIHTFFCPCPFVSL